MSFVYTQSDLKDRINAKTQGRIDMLLNAQETMNDAARDVITDNKLYMRSAKRKAALNPKLFSDIHEYTLPSDCNSPRIIHMPPQADLQGKQWFLLTSEEFDRKKDSLDGFFAVREFDGDRHLLIAADIDDDTRVVSELDSLSSGGGTWEAFGDGTNVAKDTDNFIKGSGSVSWDIDAAGGTTAGIKNTALNPFDLDDDYLGGNGAAFVYAYLSDEDNITNHALRLGSSESAYHLKTITTQHDGTAFEEGWNLLRFDLTSLSDTGSPDDDAIDYAALFMNKDASKVSQTDFRYDWLVLKKGQIYEVEYYTSFPWQSSAGAYKRNSTATNDVLVAESTEYQQLYLPKAYQHAFEELEEFEKAAYWEQKYERNRLDYSMENPGESKVITTEYQGFRNIE